MKEFSIEEKAKAYDEAIEKARLVLQEKGNEPDGTSILSKLFPELIESEDERIRKSIICALKQYYIANTVFDGFSREDMITWLEKQGQKPADKVEPKFKIGDIVKRKDNPHLTYILKRFTDDGDYEFHAIGKDGNEGCTHFAAVKCQDDWELVEQNPAEWSEEDEKMFNKLLAVVDLYYGYSGNVLDRESCTSFLKSLKDRYTWKLNREQKPLFPDNEVRDIWEYLYKFKTLYGHYPNDADEIEVIVREAINKRTQLNSE